MNEMNEQIIAHCFVCSIQDVDNWFVLTSSGVVFLVEQIVQRFVETLTMNHNYGSSILHVSLNSVDCLHQVQICLVKWEITSHDNVHIFVGHDVLVEKQRQLDT